MKLLVFVDLHGDQSVLRSIIARAKKKDIDAVVCAGDFTIFGNDQELILAKLNRIGKPVLVVHGNHEDERDVKVICGRFKQCHFIHKRGFCLNGYIFIGWGGGGFSYRDQSLEKNIKKFKQMTKKGDKVILVTHAPPYKTKVDQIIKEEHAGSKSIRKLIESIKPDLVVCGHLHECVGKDMIGKTIVINPGYKGKIVKI